MITADFNEQHTLSVTFNGFPAIPAYDTPKQESHASEHAQAQIRIKEAGYDVKPYGLTTIIIRHYEEPSKFSEGKLQKSEEIHCDPATLVGATLALDKEHLVNLLAEAFEVYQQARVAYNEEIEMAREAAGARRGRPPMADGEKRNAFVGANVAPDLKEWAGLQPEGVSALINQLLTSERERRNRRTAEITRPDGA